MLYQEHRRTKQLREHKDVHGLHHQHLHQVHRRRAGKQSEADTLRHRDTHRHSGGVRFELCWLSKGKWGNGRSQKRQAGRQAGRQGERHRNTETQTTTCIWEGLCWICSPPRETDAIPPTPTPREPKTTGRQASKKTEADTQRHRGTDRHSVFFPLNRFWVFLRTSKPSPNESEAMPEKTKSTKRNPNKMLEGPPQKNPTLLIPAEGSGE